MTEVNKRKMLVEKRAMRFSFLGSAAFVAAELVSFFLTGAHTILMDCIFDGMDLILIGPFMVLIPFLYRPETERHPYGYSQFESLFIILKYSALLAVCAGTIVDNVRLIQSGGHLVDAGDVAAFELFVMAGCLAVVFALHTLSKRYSSQIIQSELYAWKLDTVTSCGIAVAFLLQIALERTSLSWIAPYMDPIVAIVLTGLLLVEPVKEICENVRELLLFSAPSETVDHVREIAAPEVAKYGAEITFLEVVQTGRKTWIEIYVREKSDTVSVRQLAEATRSIREKLSGDFDQYCVEVVPDVDAIPQEEKRPRERTYAQRLPEREAV